MGRTTLGCMSGPSFPASDLAPSGHSPYNRPPRQTLGGEMPAEVQAAWRGRHFAEARLNARPPASPARLEWNGSMRHMIIALALLAAGCALATAAPPEVEVAGVELRGLDLLDQALGVTLCVSNPNTTELSFRKVTEALEVANAALAEGASEAPVRLPPRASVLVPFTVGTTVRNLGPQLWDVARSGGVEYRLRGSVQFDNMVGISLPFSRTGRLDLFAAGTRLLSLQGQLDLLAKGTQLLADTAAVGSATRCGRVVAS